MTRPDPDADIARLRKSFRALAMSAARADRRDRALAGDADPSTERRARLRAQEAARLATCTWIDLVLATEGRD